MADRADYCDLPESMCKTCIMADCSESRVGQDEEYMGEGAPMTVARYMQAAGWCEECDYYGREGRDPFSYLLLGLVLGALVTLLFLIFSRV